MDSLLEPVADTEERPLCTEVTRRLDIQRQNGQFCDVVIEVGSGDDKAQLKAHRNVLCTAGPFFFNALNSGMKEAQEGVIRFKDVSKAIMEKVLEYLYTGSVEITKEIAYDLLAQADFFLLPNLKALSSKFILQTLDVSNCIMPYYFAINYKDEELQKGASSFICSNFLEVADTEDFLNLSVEEIEEWISSDKIIVKEEEDVFWVIVKWMESNGKEQDLLRLLRHVRCTHLSPSFVSDVILQHPLVKGNAACENYISDAVKESADASLPTRDCLKVYKIIVTSSEKRTFCYLPSENKWYQLADKLSSHRSSYYGMSTLNNKLFVVGGCKTQDGHGAECYDPLRNEWTPIAAPDMLDIRVAVVTLNGFVYAIGGRDRNETVLNIVKKYDPNTNQWQEVAPLSSARSNVCAVSDGRYLYSLGGLGAEFPLRFLDIVERYDPTSNTWSEFPPMLARRAFAGGTAIGQNIFVFGGISMASLVENPCEVYNQETKTWRSIPSNVPLRMDASVATLNGKIYVNGIIRVQRGRRLVTRNVLQVYNVEKMEWEYFPDNRLLSKHYCEIATLTMPIDVLINCREVPEEYLRHWHTLPRDRDGDDDDDDDSDDDMRPLHLLLQANVNRNVVALN